jgi:hypothetical protein
LFGESVVVKNVNRSVSQMKTKLENRKEGQRKDTINTE